MRETRFPRPRFDENPSSAAATSQRTGPERTLSHRYRTVASSHRFRMSTPRRVATGPREFREHGSDLASATIVRGGGGPGNVEAFSSRRATARERVRGVPGLSSSRSPRAGSSLCSSTSRNSFPICRGSDTTSRTGKPKSFEMSTGSSQCRTTKNPPGRRRAADSNTVETRSAVPSEIVAIRHISLPSGHRWKILAPAGRACRRIRVSICSLVHLLSRPTTITGNTGTPTGGANTLHQDARSRARRPERHPRIVPRSQCVDPMPGIVG